MLLIRGGLANLRMATIDGVVWCVRDRVVLVVSMHLKVPQENCREVRVH